MRSPVIIQETNLLKEQEEFRLDCPMCGTPTMVAISHRRLLGQNRVDIPEIVGRAREACEECRATVDWDGYPVNF